MSRVIHLGEAWAQLDDDGQPVFRECALCGRSAALFENTSGQTHCLACPKSIAALPVPRTPQTAEQTCELLRQSIAMVLRK